MSDKTCPRCGHDNDSQLGVLHLGGPDAGEMDTGTIKCHECGHSFGVN